MSEMYKQYRKGWLEVISGCMFAGKTEELIRRIKVLEFAKQNILVFKPRIDNRYSETKIASHAGSMVESILIDRAADILDHVTEDTDVVAIDEVQFLDEDVIEVCRILHGGEGGDIHRHGDFLQRGVIIALTHGNAQRG